MCWSRPGTTASCTRCRSFLDTRIVVYRKDHFAEAGIKKTPANWAELRAVAKQLTKTAGLDSTRSPSICASAGRPSSSPTAGQLFSADGKEVLFTDARGVEALQFFKDLVKDGSADYAKKTELGARPTY
ncbi:extracellular solute-binding protein, partial [Streptomyces yanii]|uniref:extracellular solute-binding protein n=1 Tax=Streptomyces yanii TaxID=78510 RepID=UPI0031EB5BB5